MVSTRVTPVTVVMMVPCSVTVRTPVVVIVTGSVTVTVTIWPAWLVEVERIVFVLGVLFFEDFILEDLVLDVVVPEETYQ